MITIERLERFFSDHNIPLDPDGFEDRHWRHRCVGDNGEWDYAIHWAEEPLYVRVTSTFPKKIPSMRRADVAQVVARTNAGLRVGGLSLDLDSGELSFITGLLLEGIDEDFEKLMEQIFFVNMASMEELSSTFEELFVKPGDESGDDPLALARSFHAHLEGNGWPIELLDHDTIDAHDPSDHVRIKSGCRASNGQWFCMADIQPDSDIVAFYSFYPVEVPSDRRDAMSAFITLANYGMFIGNFAMDVSDGELRFKTSVDVEDLDSDTAKHLFDRLVAANIATMDRYFPGITAVMEGQDPERAIALIEN